MPIRDDTFLKRRREFLIEVGICAATGQVGPLEVAHIRYPDAYFGKADAGMGLKPGHEWTVPLLVEEHRAQHATGERAYWRSRGFAPAGLTDSPLVVAGLLTHYQTAEDVDGARRFLQERAERARQHTWSRVGW